MNNKMSMIKQSTKEIKMNMSTNINIKGKSSLGKHQDDYKMEVDNNYDNKNSNAILSNLSKLIIEDLKSILSIKSDYSNDWVEMIEKKHQELNMEMNGFLKLACKIIFKY